MIILIVFILIVHVSKQIEAISCKCQLFDSGMTMICDHVHSLSDYQQCVHDLLSSQSDFKLRRAGLITNLTIRHHQLETLSNGLLEFSHGNVLYQLTDLRYLHVVHGILKRIDNRALSLVERPIECIDLSHNQLQQMPKARENIQIYENLVKLILSNNEIRRLVASDLRVYPKLEHLDMSHNLLESIEMSFVPQLKSLKRLFLNSNQLKILSSNESFPQVFHLKLNSNRFECDCHLRWLRNALNRVEYPTSHDDPKCETPKTLAERRIVSLSDEQFVCGPSISKSEPNTVTVTSGDQATLRCDVYSDPAPDVWWTFRNKIIGRIISNGNQDDIQTGSYTIRHSCLYSHVDSSSNNCLNKTTTLTISNIDVEHNGTYNCVAAIKNQGRSDNEFFSYELRVHRTSPLAQSSIFLWSIGAILFVFLTIIIVLCFCWIRRCYQSKTNQAQRNKTLLIDSYNNQQKRDSLVSEHCDPYDLIDSKSQLGLGPPMYSEVRLVDSTPLKNSGCTSVSSTLLRRQVQQQGHESFYDGYRQLYEQNYQSSPLPGPNVDEFDDEIIFPTGYEENYEYREDIIKPNQVIDPRRENQHFSTNDDRNESFENCRLSQQRLIVTPNHQLANFIVSSNDSNDHFQFDRSQSQYAGLVESHL